MLTNLRKSVANGTRRGSSRADRLRPGRMWGACRLRRGPGPAAPPPPTRASLHGSSSRGRNMSRATRAVRAPESEAAGRGTGLPETPPSTRPGPRGGSHGARPASSCAPVLPRLPMTCPASRMQDEREEEEPWPRRRVQVVGTRNPKGRGPPRPQRKNETVRKIIHTPSLRHFDSVSLLSGY